MRHWHAAAHATQWQPASRDVDHDGFLEWYYSTPVTVHYVRAFRIRANKISIRPLRLWEMLRFTLGVFASPLMLIYCNLEIS
jgi:hypothetical protein